MISVKDMISVIRCHHLALSHFLHAAYFLSTVFEETALKLYSHKDVRMALPAQRTMWQEAVMIANAKKEKPRRVRAEGSLSPDIFLIPSPSPQPWRLHRLGASSGRCWPKSQHQSPMYLSTTFLFSSCTYFIYFWPPQQYLTIASTISSCISFIESWTVCSLGQWIGVLLGRVSWSSLEVCIWFNGLISTQRAPVPAADIHGIPKQAQYWGLFQLKEIIKLLI